VSESSIFHPLWVFIFTLLTGKNNRDALIKTYFDHVYPFAPVINRADFIRDYQSGDYSLFLLRVMLTPASLHAPADVLFACGFASRSAAQESFFSKAKLLHDFADENGTLLMLQGSIILCMVILDHPSDRDFGYWFHNAIRLATKIDLRNTCVREDKPRKVLKLYRRIWWALYVRPSSRHRVLFLLLYAYYTYIVFRHFPRPYQYQTLATTRRHLRDQA
jgi:hypothetical protein